MNSQAPASKGSSPSRDGAAEAGGEGDHPTAPGPEGSEPTGDGAAEADSEAGGTTEIGYAEAMAELEGILEELEGEDPDVDVLADRVQRAATLIEVCRRRIANAGVQVERVVAALESDGAT